MKIAVLNAVTGNLSVFEIPQGVDVELYLAEEEGYNLENIDWMEVKSININIVL